MSRWGRGRFNGGGGAAGGPAETWAKTLEAGLSSGAFNPSILSGQFLEGAVELALRATGANPLTLRAQNRTYDLSSDGAVLATTAQSIIQAINEAFAAAGLSSSMFQFTTITSFDTGSLGFTPKGAVFISSDGSSINVGIFNGSVSGAQSEVAFTIGLANGVIHGKISGAGTGWTCSQFTEPGVVGAGPSVDAALLVFG